MSRGWKKAAVIFGAILGVACAGCLFLYTQVWNSKVDVVVNNAGNFPLTVEQRLEDFNYLYNILEESFPYFEVKKRQFGIDWLSRKDEFVEKIKSVTSDREYYQVLNEILMLLQNGHTNIIPPGSDFEEFKNIYKGPIPWDQVFGNEKVEACYEYWKNVVPESGNAVIPVAFTYVEGNYYSNRNIINPERTTDELGVPMGSRLTKINGTNIDQYIRELVTSRLLKYDGIREKFKVNQLVIRSNNEIELTFITPEGNEGRKKLKPYRPDSLGGSQSTYPEHLYSTEIIEENKIAYIKLPSFASYYVDKDRDGMVEFFKEIKDYDSLIIDIRGNGGGSTNYWMSNVIPYLSDKDLVANAYIILRKSEYTVPFIKNKTFLSYYWLKPIKDLSFYRENPEFYLRDDNAVYDVLDYNIKSRNSEGFKGKIYLLVDDYVYSSAESFAVFAKATGWATLVGTRTGGDGIGFDPIAVALPNSGLIVRFPADMGLNPDGSINEETATVPDIYIEQSYEDFHKLIMTGKKLSDFASARDKLPYDTVLRKAVEFSLEN